MPKAGCAVVNGIFVVGAFVLASLPVSAQRISADAARAHFAEALRGHRDGQPDKSVHHLSTAGFPAATIRAASAAARAKHRNAPQSIVSPFFYPSSRSRSVNYGFLVGPNPFAGDDDPRRASVKTFIIPVVIKVHQVATDFSRDANGNLILTGIKDQDATYDPTVPAPACLGPKNNVPFTLAVQSPIFQNQHWVWGGTDLGDAQFVEAFQRANFWNATGEDPGRYRGVHLDAQTVPPLVIDFPKGSGIGLPQSSSFFGYSACAPSVLVDINLFDEYLDYIAIPQMTNVNSGNFPIFIAGNVAWGLVIGQLPYYETEASGYHSISLLDPAQTYAVSSFGDDNVLNFPDASTLNHEVAEWMNDPTGANLVQSYNVEALYSPQPLCQENYEVGDILDFTNMPPVTGVNGYSYTLQELAFFSYFYGGPSFAVNGWYSTNNTLTSDAGPACVY